MKQVKLFHVSENPEIKTFIPRPSPSEIKGVEGDVVFAICERLLHNYLLPRDCPRVTFYAKPDSLKSDVEKFLRQSDSEFVIVIENNWVERVANTILYRYEFTAKNFMLIDEGAGYYVSDKTVIPITVTTIQTPVIEIMKRNVEIRCVQNLRLIAEEIVNSSLQYSLIRMRNALK